MHGIAIIGNSLNFKIEINKLYLDMTILIKFMKEETKKLEKEFSTEKLIYYCRQINDIIS